MAEPTIKRRRVKVKRIEAIEPVAGVPEQLDQSLPEGRFQDICEEVAQRYGWVVYHETDSRLSARGLPDLIALSPVQADGSVVLAMLELKSAKGKLTPEQDVWLTKLYRLGSVVTGWVRPAQWGQVLALLFDPAKAVEEDESDVPEKGEPHV